MTNVQTAPVALFVFNRPQPTSQMFDRVRKARPHRLLVIADGPRSERPEDGPLCDETREIVSAPDWPCELSTNLASRNLGCRQRLSSGLDWVFSQCSEAIILEDDCLPCASFFSFCTAMLERYRNDERIMHISGSNFGEETHWGGGSYYFSRYSFSWGWASWKRAWHHYDVNLGAWPVARSEHWLMSILENAPEIHYWTEIFARLYRGEIDTWDYQWLFSCWRNGGLSIVPNRNLVTNIGMGSDSLHFKEDHKTIGVPTHELNGLVHPDSVARDKEADRISFDRYIGGNGARENQGWFRRMKKKITLRTRAREVLNRFR